MEADRINRHFQNSRPTQESLKCRCEYQITYTIVLQVHGTLLSSLPNPTSTISLSIPPLQDNTCKPHAPIPASIQISMSWCPALPFPISYLEVHILLTYFALTFTRDGKIVLVQRCLLSVLCPWTNLTMSCPFTRLFPKDGKALNPWATRCPLKPPS